MHSVLRHQVGAVCVVAGALGMAHAVAFASLPEPEWLQLRADLASRLFTAGTVIGVVEDRTTLGLALLLLNGCLVMSGCLLLVTRTRGHHACHAYAVLFGACFFMAEFCDSLWDVLADVHFRQVPLVVTTWPEALWRWGVYGFTLIGNSARRIAGRSTELAYPVVLCLLLHPKIAGWLGRACASRPTRGLASVFFESVPTREQVAFGVVNTSVGALSAISIYSAFFKHVFWNVYSYSPNFIGILTDYLIFLGIASAQFVSGIGLIYGCAWAASASRLYAWAAILIGVSWNLPYGEWFGVNWNMNPSTALEYVYVITTTLYGLEYPALLLIRFQSHWREGRTSLVEVRG